MPNCRCYSLSVFVEKIKVLAPTTRGSGLPEKIFGWLIKRDDVSFVAISEGIRLNYPPGGRKAWPDSGDWTLGVNESAPNDRIRIATVVPAACNVEINTLAQFYEHDWDSLQALLEQAVEHGVQLGLVSAPPQAGFFTTLAKDAIKVFKEILDMITSLKSEHMGDVVFRLPLHDLADPIPLADFPWGAELARNKMFDKKQDSFKYKTELKRWGGRWEVSFFVQRRCDPWSSSSSSSSSRGLPSSSSPGLSSSSGPSSPPASSSSSGGGSSSSSGVSSSADSSSSTGELFDEVS
jgi:hypothetical protein